MSKHTPGPWQVNDSNPLQVCDCDGEVRGCAPIAHVVKTGQPKPRAEDIANASLIAAAPDLLTALRDLLSRADKLIWRPAVDDSRQIDQDTRNLREGLEPARAAIAKAEGR